jgi:hypothetical protein
LSSKVPQIKLSAQEIVRIQDRFGEEVAEALEFAVLNGFPTLEHLQYLGAEVQLESRVRQFDNTIQRFIEIFEISDFWQTFQQRQRERNLVESSRTPEELARRRVSGRNQHWEVFNAIQSIPNGYYSHGMHSCTI